MASAVMAIIISSPVPAVWAETFYSSYDNYDILAALSTAPIVPSEAKELASSFVDRTLPRLLADNALLAKQLGFGSTKIGSVVLNQPLPLMIIYHKDVQSFALGKSDPISLIANTNNWMKDQAGKLVPRRLVFSLKANDSDFESGSTSWSSVTVEMLSSDSWRIVQVGAPKLARAMKLYEAPRTGNFLLWIPDLNRHYLGQIKSDGMIPSPKISIILTVLFDDPLAQRSAGEEINITDIHFLPRLQKLYQRLQEEKVLHSPTDPNQIRTAAP